MTIIGKKYDVTLLTIKILSKILRCKRNKTFASYAVIEKSNNRKLLLTIDGTIIDYLDCIKSAINFNN